MIVTDQTPAADGSNVRPAVEVPPNTRATGFERLQLTQDALTNLTDLKLSNISLFYFDNDAQSGKRSAGSEAQCKSMPGDLLYPNQAVWKVLNILSGGALIKTVPLGSACYDGEHYDEAKCQFLIDNWNVSDTQ